MTVYNLGSINIDIVYQVPHLPQPGETLAARDRFTGLGGKGANQSVAAARGGASRVCHLGRIGSDGIWARDRLAGFGVDIGSVRLGDGPTGHAVIYVDPQGENEIVLFPGENQVLEDDDIAADLAQAGAGDLLLMQNETCGQVAAARAARARGAKIIYSAAPFDAAAVRTMLPHTDLLVVNAVEAQQLSQAMGLREQELPLPELLVTRGAEGAVWYDLRAGTQISAESIDVTPVDTTGAGDTFIGFLAAGLEQGLTKETALRRSIIAAGLCVTKAGTTDAIPDLASVLAYETR